MASIKDNVIEILIKNSIITKEQLDEALLIHKE